VEFSGQKLVVIGGTSGIGLAVAQRAAALGAQLVVGSSSTETIDRARPLLPATTEAFTVDVTDEAQIAAFFETVGAFDHLVFTAGDWGTPRGRLIDLDLSAARQVFSVRFWGAVSAVKYAHTAMPAGGSITLTDGMLGHRPRTGAALSTAMLGAIEHLVKGLAVELAPVRVNAVCPGLIATERNLALPEQTVTKMTGRQAIPRAGLPDEVAEAYLYLMRGGYTTGQVLMVDGGLILT
jgi:NAD(P)-dependent dehydrogenase (short-subunit alcohol dehydrogenase family)